MRWDQGILTLGLSAALFTNSAALASDHRDGTAVLFDPATDLNDVYSWMSADGTKVYLVMTVFPAADKATSKFSNAAYYVFHTASRASFAPGLSTSLDVTCTFDAAQKINCWVGTQAFLSGDASNVAGLSSANGKARVYAGVRKDHAFFNLDGWNATRGAYRMIDSALVFDVNGCPQIGSAQSTALLNQLGSNATGGAASNFFQDLNTLAIVFEIDKSLLTAGGNILSVWAATHKKVF